MKFLYLKCDNLKVIYSPESACHRCLWQFRSLIERRTAVLTAVITMVITADPVDLSYVDNFEIWGQTGDLKLTPLNFLDIFISTTRILIFAIWFRVFQQKNLYQLTKLEVKQRLNCRRFLTTCLWYFFNARQATVEIQNDWPMKFGRWVKYKKAVEEIFTGGWL